MEVHTFVDRGDLQESGCCVLEGLAGLWTVKNLDRLSHPLELLRTHASARGPCSCLLLTIRFGLLKEFLVGLELLLSVVQVGLTVRKQFRLLRIVRLSFAKR